VLEQEHVLALFPEGTRSRDGVLKPFRFGAARLALKHNAQLVPAAIVGTERAMPAGAKFPKRTGVKIAFGPPLNLAPYRYNLSGSTPEAHMLEAVTSLLQTAVGRLKEGLDREANTG
jgi:1-acyl-sn-glycerol-3-phosphate acyltransferase